MADLTDYQRDILIRTALGEARGEGVEGMADVLQVILNRANSGQFPSDPAAVALQNKQFSTWNRGEGGNNPQQFKPGSKAYQTAAQALDAVASGARPDPTGGALYYHTPAVSPSWSRGVNTNGTIKRNGHVFYPSRPVPPMDIPSVGTLLSTARSAPTPSKITPTSAAVRQMTSPSGGNTDLQNALNRVATRERNRVTPRTMQGKVTTVASIPTTSSLTAPGAISGSIGSTRQDPALAAALARRINPVSASDKTRNSPAQTRNVATTIASIPTTAAPVLGGTPTTRSVPTTRVVPPTSASDRVRGNPFQSGVQSSRVVASYPTTPQPMPTGSQIERATGLRGPQAQPNTGLKAQDRLAPNPGLDFVPAPVAPKPVAAPAMRSVQIPNPAYRSPVPAANTPQSGGLSRDAVAQRAAGAATAANVPRYLTVQRPVAVPPVAAQPMPVRAPVMQPLPMQRPPLNVLVQGSNTARVAPVPAPLAQRPVAAPQFTSTVQGFINQGFSPAEAYAAAGAKASRPVNAVEARVRGSRGGDGGDGGVQPRGTIW